MNHKKRELQSKNSKRVLLEMADNRAFLERKKIQEQKIRDRKKEYKEFAEAYEYIFGEKLK